MKLFIIIAGLLMLGACTGKTEGFVLKGELEGAPDDHWVFLTKHAAGQQQSTGSAITIC